MRYETKFLDASLGVQDLLASITWRQNVRTLAPAQGEGFFSFSGIDINGLITNGQIDTL